MLLNDPSPRDLTIIMPVFNDWESFKLLVRKIDSLDLQDSWHLSILAVNDGSLLELGPEIDCLKNLSRIGKVDILHLTRNLGHQRAIAVAGVCSSKLKTGLRHCDGCRWRGPAGGYWETSGKRTGGREPHHLRSKKQTPRGGRVSLLLQALPDAFSHLHRIFHILWPLLPDPFPAA